LTRCTSCAGSISAQCTRRQNQTVLEPLRTRMFHRHSGFSVASPSLATHSLHSLHQTCTELSPPKRMIYLRITLRGRES